MENGAYAIGNTPLPKDKYLAMKDKLLSETAELAESGKAFSLLKILEKCGKYAPDPGLKFGKGKWADFDPSQVERAFCSASSLLFKREIGALCKFADYLWRHVPKNVVLRSPLSGTDVSNCGYRAHVLEKFAIGRRVASEDEIRSIGAM